MNEKTFAAISLSDRDFPNFQAKLEEAVRWVELAAIQGAQLALLPEMLNVYRSDLDLAGVALENWKMPCAPLLDAARNCGIALGVPLVTRSDGAVFNRFFLLSKTGEQLGEYQKEFPTPEELSAGISPGHSKLIAWEGLKLGGAICFDTNFPSVFAQQADRGADLFLIPSLWPGGTQLNYYAMEYATPIVLAYPAWSRIIDIDGHDVAEGGYRNETLRFGFGSAVVIAMVNFDRVQLHADHNQKKMVDVQRHYGDRIRIHFRQENCMFILESRSHELTVNDVVQRFELIPRRRYLSQCGKLCAQRRQARR